MRPSLAEKASQERKVRLIVQSYDERGLPYIKITDGKKAKFLSNQNRCQDILRRKLLQRRPPTPP